MKQKLVFVAAWDKTIADRDRIWLQKTFENTVIHQGKITLTTFRQAKNYKGEFLITVLIHNATDQLLAFDKRTVHYTQNGNDGNYLFTFPSLVVEPLTSTPWTFIFPPESHLDINEEIQLSL